MKNKIMEIVTKICDTQSTNCRSLNKAELAKELLAIANVPENAEIQEIPVDWNNQVVVLFLLPNDNNYYSLFAGIGNSGNFYFKLTITGVIAENGEEFDFFETEKDLDIDYFLSKNQNISSIEDKQYQIAKEFNIVDMVEKLQNELLQVDGVTEVDFDLSGFYDNMNEVIFLTKYSISNADNRYFEKRKELINQVVGVAEGNFLTRTQDSIEDYGEHFYFVFHCFKEWNRVKN